MFNDDKEYEIKCYNNLLNNWESRYFKTYKDVRAYWSEENKQAAIDNELQVSSPLAKKIYTTLNKQEDGYFALLEMYTNLAKCSYNGLKTAEKVLPEFMSFLDEANLDAEGKQKLKVVFPHIAESYDILYRDEDKKPSFTEFIRPLNKILQRLERGKQYSAIRAFNSYLFNNDGTLTKNEMEARLCILKAVAEKTNDSDVVVNICNDFRNYSRAFPETITQFFLTNMVDYIIPRAVKKNDIFGVQGNKWGCRLGKGISKGVGAATYAYKCYATEITPCGINDLLQMSYEVLGANQSKHEQIRKDALILNNWFPRDPIHDSAPGVNEIIAKMVAYYDATPENKEEALAELQKCGKRVNALGDRIYDLSKYDELSYMTKEPHIDILRRINNNMSANNNEIPLTENESLNLLAESANKHEQPVLRDVVPLIKAINSEILSAMEKKQTGFSPEVVSLIAWTDRRLALAINNMDFERQLSFYKSDECKEILMFSELTHSAEKSFDKDEFEAFYTHQVKKAFDMEEAYKNIGNRQNNLLFGLYKQYDADCERMDNTSNAKIMTEARKERAGSGNTLKALQNLTIYHEPSTKVGQRAKKEREQRGVYRTLMLNTFSNTKLH